MALPSNRAVFKVTPWRDQFNLFTHHPPPKGAKKREGLKVPHFGDLGGKIWRKCQVSISYPSPSEFSTWSRMHHHFHQDVWISIYILITNKILNQEELIKDNPWNFSM